MKKILSILGKIVLSIILLYLFLGFIAIPLTVKWAIEAKGLELLKTPVKVKLVYLNPIMMSMSVHGLEIQDAAKKPVVGFKRLHADVSFLSVFKKPYRVEDLSLDGLYVDARLLKGNRMNLMDLVPQEAPNTHAAEAKSSTTTASQELPLVIIDKVALTNSQIRFTDETVSPQFATVLGDINILVTGLSTAKDSLTRVDFKARLDEKGVIASETLIKPFVQPLDVETSMTFNNYALQVLSPYVGKYTGRKLDNGKFDLRMDYKIANNELTASHKILVQNFEFGSKVESKDAINLPYGLALALLEDSKGQIKITLPVTGKTNDPKFNYWRLIGQVCRNFFMKVITKPFAFLGSVLGDESGTDELGYVRFEPGKADLSEAEQKKLAKLVEGLRLRPKLKLEVKGSYDPKTDWKAIKTDTFMKEYQALRKESQKDESKVYEMLYQRSFGIKKLWQFAKKYNTGKFTKEQENEAIKNELIENAPVDQAAVDVLASARAKQVYDAIVALGFDASRLSVGRNQDVQSNLGYVPLEFTLTVLETK